MKGWSTGKLEQGLNHGFDNINLSRIVRPVFPLCYAGLILKQLGAKQHEQNSAGSFICVGFLFQMLKLPLFPKTITGISFTLAWWKMRFHLCVCAPPTEAKKHFSWCLRIAVNGWSWGNLRAHSAGSQLIRALCTCKFKLKQPYWNLIMCQSTLLDQEQYVLMKENK